MTRDEIKSGLEEILKVILSLPSVKITETTTARDFKGWDSLAHIDIIIAAEETFKVRISATKAARLKTIGELITLIHEKKNE
ncbi:MAG: acyl carrier protein [Bdellovibrionota bacterium]